jgi:four helix bundle protein
MTTKRFEDLVVWQRSRQLTKRVYQVSADNRFSRDFRFASQIQAAAVSVMSNIAEGFDRRTSGEFQQFLRIAKASCAEVRSDLYVALDLSYIDEATFHELYGLADEVARMLESLRAKVVQQRDRPKTA